MPSLQDFLFVTNDGSNPQLNRTCLTAEQLVILATRHVIRLTSDERTKLSGAQLAALAAAGVTAPLTQTERERIDPIQLAMLQILGILTLTEAECERLPPLQRSMFKTEFISRPTIQPRHFFDGDPDESYFHNLYATFHLRRDLANLFRVADQSNDHRIIALTRAMVVENRLDFFLGSFLPNYSRVLANDKNFTFSMKIKLLKATGLIPDHIREAADAVRDARNQFAHTLECRRFEEMEPKVQARLKTVFQKVPGQSATDDLLKMFQMASFFAAGGLDNYANNARFLVEQINKPLFKDALPLIAENDLHTAIENAMKQPPIHVRQEGGATITEYPGVNHIDFGPPSTDPNSPSAPPDSTQTG